MLNDTQRLTIHGAWWIRHETLEESADRVVTTFQKLCNLNSSWAHWYKPHRRPEDKLHIENQALSSHETVMRQLEISQEPDGNGDTSEDLGYTLSVLSEPRTGKGIARSLLQVRCCSRTQNSGFNTISLELPQFRFSQEIYKERILSHAVAELADIWEPDWIAVWDLQTHLTQEPWPPKPAFGWINYLSPKTGKLLSLPSGWRWSDLGSEKQIYVHCGGPPDRTNPSHAENFRRLFANIEWAVGKSLP